MSDNSLFENTNQEPKTVKWEDLVGDDKKFKTQDDVAKKIVSSDEHIQRIERENEEMRKALAEGKTVEDIIRRQEELYAKQRQQASNNGTPPSEEPEQKAESKFNPEDIERIVEERLSQREQTSTRQRNLNSVADKMKQDYGTDVRQVWEQIKTDMSVDEEGLRNMASSNPQVVLSLARSIRPVAPPKPSVDVFGTTIDSSKNLTSGVVPKGRTNKYYNEIMKKQGGTLTGQQASQRLKDAQVLGEAFFE